MNGKIITIRDLNKVKFLILFTIFYIVVTLYKRVKIS